MQLLAWRQRESCTTIEKTMEMKCRHPYINTYMHIYISTELNPIISMLVAKTQEYSPISD